jgi:hypothetical protein
LRKNITRDDAPFFWTNRKARFLEGSFVCLYAILNVGPVPKTNRDSESAPPFSSSVDATMMTRTRPRTTALLRFFTWQLVMILFLCQQESFSFTIPLHQPRTSPGVVILGALNDPNQNDDDEGAQLAAAFFKTAQSKGIRIDANDLLDEEEEEEEEDDDEEAPNIPQGAINAFLGYDTGNVGEKLAGNVTLTNDQLYSEVKERVLESAGGFVAFVTGATEDDDDDDEEDTTRSTPRAAEETPPYVVPTVVPDSELTAGEVVLLVLEALRHNDDPTPNRGVEILFGYASPGSHIRQEVGLTPKEYAEFLNETEYKILFSHATHSPIPIDKADYSPDGRRAFFTARLWKSPDAPRDTVSVNFLLSTTAGDDAVWLIDSLLIRPPAMRRRRRK